MITVGPTHFSVASVIPAFSSKVTSYSLLVNIQLDIGFNVTMDNNNIVSFCEWIGQY